MGFSALSWRISRLTLAVPLLAVIAITASLGLLTPRTAEALDSEEQQFLVLLNEYRAQNGLGPLTTNNTLNDIAGWMANDMATKNYFSHTDSLGRDPFQRMDELGYSYNTWRGENLVAGTETAPYAFQMWKDSPGHNANMLGANYTVVGIARRFNPNSSYGWYWATEFGGEGGSTPAPPPQAPPQAPPPVHQPATAPPAYNTVPPTAHVTAPPSPAPTAEVTPEPANPEPMVWTGPVYAQTAWWRSLDAVTEEWNRTTFARRIMALSPSLEELFVAMMRDV